MLAKLCCYRHFLLHCFHHCQTHYQLTHRYRLLLPQQLFRPQVTLVWCNQYPRYDHFLWSLLRQPQTATN